MTASFREIDEVNAVNIMAESMLCATRAMVFRGMSCMFKTFVLPLCDTDG